MRTKRPISTISYNSEDYLKFRLDEQLRLRNIVFWSYIKHLPDTDDKKEHFHVYLEPAKTIDTVLFADNFVEIVPTHPKPLKTLAIVYSKFPDWYLYGLHDSDYLADHGLKRNLHYRDDDFVYSDFDEMNFRVHSIDFRSFHGFQSLLDSAESGVPITVALREGIIPKDKIGTWFNVYKSVMQEHYRSFRKD